MKAAKAVGPWDTSIPYYRSDTDYYDRMHAKGYKIVSQPSGSLVSSWPHKDRIVHLGGGSVVIHASQNFSQQGAGGSTLTKEEQWGLWVMDYVGRYVYYRMKWGYDSQDILTMRTFETT